MITAIHHVQITIPRGAEEAARAFYCGVLGLAEIEKPESLSGRGGFWLGVGDRSLHIGAEDGVDRTRSKAHVAHEVTDLDAFRRRLRDAGVAIIESIPIPGHDRFEIRDPFGNRVEIIQPHKPAVPPAVRDMHIPQRISSERLDIVGPRQERLDADAAELNAAIVETIDELTPWMPWARPVPSVQQTRDNLLRAEEKWRRRTELRLLLFLKGTGTLVGSSGLHDLEWEIPRFEIGYWIRSRFAGQGYATEAVRAIAQMAFTSLGACRLEIRTSASNQRSIAVARRAGFELEAVLRDDMRLGDGTLCDSHIYTRLRDADQAATGEGPDPDRE